MAGKGPGKYWRNGIGLGEFFELFPDDEAAEQFFIRARWPYGDVSCPRCGGDSGVYKSGFSLRSRTACQHATAGHQSASRRAASTITRHPGTPTVRSLSEGS